MLQSAQSLLGVTDRSEGIAFTSLPAVGDVQEQRIGLIGDLGDTANSTVTLAHVIANSVDIVLNVGDLVRRETSPA